MTLCCIDVGHEGGEVFVPGIVSIPCVVVGVTRLPVDQVGGVRVVFGRDIEPRACLPFVVPEGEEVDACLAYVLGGGDLLVGDWVGDFVEPLFCEAAVVPEGR